MAFDISFLFREYANKYMPYHFSLNQVILVEIQAIQFLNDIKTIAVYVVLNTNLIRIILAVTIVVSSILLRKAFLRFVVSFLHKSEQRPKIKVLNHLVKVLEAPARFLIVVMGVWCAMFIINIPYESRSFMDRIFRSLIVFSIFRSAYRASDILTVLLYKFSGRREVKLDDMLVSFIRKCTKVLIVVMGTLTIVQEWYSNIGGLLAGLGLGGLAFALAAKDTVANLFGSITIMLDRPFKIGDRITTPHAEGVIEEIGFRSTRVRTSSQALITIPNSIMSNDSITNWSKMGKRRISFTLGFKYSTDPKQLREFISRLKEVLKTHQEVNQETIVVCFEKLGNSSLEVLFYFFTNSTDWAKWLEVQEEINFSIMEKLNELGLEVAIPLTNINTVK